jgi:Phage tail assembly chaperone protein
MKLEDIILPYKIETTSQETMTLIVKAWRNQQLSACDWTQLPDVDLANKWDWATYRQALRDLPQQGDDPKVWVFPVPPT